jgi:hypothetical protein
LQGQKKRIEDTNSELYKKLSTHKIVKDNLDEYLDPNKIWNEWCKLLFEYCDKEKTVPPYKIEYNNQKIGIWLSNQKQHIEDTNSEIYKKLSVNKIIKDNLDEYLKNKELTKDKIKSTWDESCKLLFEYCNKEKQCPSKKIEYCNQKIGSWLSHQKQCVKDINSELYKKLSINKIVKDNLDEYLKNRELIKDKVKLN